MRRFYIPLLLLLVVAAFALGVAWRIYEIDKCADAGGTVVGAWTRTQTCVMPHGM